MAPPAATPQSQQTLAQMVRAKYPGAYDDMPDGILEQRVLAKYPAYHDLPLSAPNAGLAAPAGAPPSRAQAGASMQPSYLAPAHDPALDQAIYQADARTNPTPGDALAGAGTLAAGTGVGAAAGVALPFLARQAAAHPTATRMIASEAIGQARKVPYVGRFIPPGSEWLPFLIGGKGGAAAEAEEGAATAQPAQTPPELTTPTRTLPGQVGPERIYGPRPTPAQPIPPRSGLQLTGEVQAPEAPAAPAAPAPSRAELSRQLEQALGGQQLQPNVPLRQQLPFLKSQAAEALPEGHVPVESSAVRSYRYDPQAREFHAQAKSGNTIYVYGDVPPEEAQNFAEAESKGKAWQQIRQNPLVAKIVNGKRLAVTPSPR